jgi:hypothetical protein
MSKSDASQKGVLYLDDSPDVLLQKIQKAKTDSLPGKQKRISFFSAKFRVLTDDTMVNWSGNFQSSNLSLLANRFSIFFFFQFFS